MNNYMRFLIEHKEYTPKHFKPEKGYVITGDHVCRFYGVVLARALTGNRSVEDIWSTRESLSAVPSIKESMTQDAFKDLCRCMHFADDWEEDDER